MICAHCQKLCPAPRQTELGFFAFFGTALCPDGAGRLLAEGALHMMTMKKVCPECSKSIFQPAWLPLSPNEAMAETRRTT